MDENLYPKRLRVRWRWDGDDGDFITYQNPATGAISILNPLAAAIFSRCDGRSSIGAIVDQILAEFDAPSRERVLHDAVEFLGFLSNINAIALLDGTAPGPIRPQVAQGPAAVCE
jgi:hypothetical protein